MAMTLIATEIPGKRDRVLQILRDRKGEIRQHGVKSLAIFGSVARDEATAASDVDVLVEFDGAISFDRYMDLKFYLEDCLTMRVDLASHRALRPQIRANVEKDAIYVT